MNGQLTFDKFMNITEEKPPEHKCGRALKDAESILRGYGPVCYKKIMPPRPKKTRAAKGDCSPVDDWDYEVPGQMELSDFIEMPKGGNDDD